MNNTVLLQNGTFQMSLTGKFTFSDHESFREVIERITDAEVKRIVINFAETTYVDSAAMGMLLLARDEAAKHQKSLVLEAATGQVKRMFEMANFQNLFVLQ